MKRILALVCCVLIAGTMFISCTDSTSTAGTATLLTLSELRNSAGYTWFDAEIALYTPDNALVQQISQAWQEKKQKVYFFVNPSCTCNGTKKTFPHAIRILKDAGIPDSMIVIYSMRSAKDDHPLQSRFTLRGLPSIFITSGTDTRYALQVIDDQLYGAAPSQPDTPVGSIALEKAMADGFTR
jgi:hypothetical protein